MQIAEVGDRIGVKEDFHNNTRRPRLPALLVSFLQSSLEKDLRGESLSVALQPRTRDEEVEEEEAFEVRPVARELFGSDELVRVKDPSHSRLEALETKLLAEYLDLPRW